MQRCIPDYLNALREAITRYGKRAVEYAPDEDTKDTYEKRIKEMEEEIYNIENPPKKPGFFKKLFGR